MASAAPLAKPRADFDRRYPDRREAMARAFQTGVYSMQEIADYFGVHYPPVSRAVRQLEAGDGRTARLISSDGMLDWNT